MLKTSCVILFRSFPVSVMKTKIFIAITVKLKHSIKVVSIVVLSANGDNVSLAYYICRKGVLFQEVREQ